jgi:prepilin-type N-terminal cleavage/methylation domain-containing protein
MGKQGFSLIEVIIFITILALFFVVAAAVTSTTIRNMKINEHKTIATHYADELTEWLRYQKESDWTSFVALSGERCFGSDLATNPIGITPCTTNNISPLYTRSAIFTPSENTTTQVEVKVAWTESGNVPYVITQNTLFTLYE